MKSDSHSSKKDRPPSKQIHSPWTPLTAHHQVVKIALYFIFASDPESTRKWSAPQLSYHSRLLMQKALRLTASTRCHWLWWAEKAAAAHLITLWCSRSHNGAESRKKRLSHCRFCIMVGERSGFNFCFPPLLRGWLIYTCTSQIFFYSYVVKIWSVIFTFRKRSNRDCRPLTVAAAAACLCGFTHACASSKGTHRERKERSSVRSLTHSPSRLLSATPRPANTHSNVYITNTLCMYYILCIEDLDTCTK